MGLGAAALALFLSVDHGRAAAQIRMAIPEPGGAGLPVAVSPLARGGAGPGRGIGERFAELLGRDLAVSGYFRMLDSRAYIEGPQGYTLEEIDFRNWSVLGALVLVKGAFSVDGDRLILEARLFDVAQRKMLGGRRYRGRPEDWRRMAHRFADQILFDLTGERGPFDSRIAFVSRRAGRAKDIYVMDLSGDEVSRVTPGATLNLFPSWRPDGRALLFFSFMRGGPHPYTLEIGGGGAPRRVAGSPSFGGAWSPSGRTLAVSLERHGDSDLFLVSPEGKMLRQLTRHPGIDVSPAWSPQGSEIAFCSSRSGRPQIYVMSVHSGRARRLTFRGTYNTSPAWSPKGNEIAYTGRVPGGFAVFTISTRGGEPKQLAFGEDPSWSPDGRYLVFSSTRRGRASLYVMTREGRSIRRLTGGLGDDTNPVWSDWLD